MAFDVAIKRGLNQIITVQKCTRCPRSRSMRVLKFAIAPAFLCLRWNKTEPER